MEFTPQQKLIIGLLTDIHQKLQITDSYDAKFIQKVVSSDNGWALPWAYDELSSPTSEDPDDVEFVSEVLEMWELLEQSYNALTRAERNELSERAQLPAEGVKFQGFDGNNESDLRSIASILIDDLNRWTHFSGRQLRTPGRTTQMHHRMLDVFRRIIASGGGLLDVERLAEVMNARIVD